MVADILDEEQLEDLVLVLAGVHTAAELITARSEGAIEFPLGRHAASLPADYGACVARRHTSGWTDARDSPSWSPSNTELLFEHVQLSGGAHAK